MRLYPTEIEAGLRAHYPGCTIGDWWQGRMSSRELLVLLRHLPDDSAYKTEERGGEWSAKVRMLQTGVNELSKLRASYHGMHGSQYEPVLWISPGELRAQAEEDEVGQELQADLADQFFGRS